MGTIGIISRTLSPRVALIVGALVSCLAMVLLILAVNFRDLVVYLLATAAAGGAYSLLFVGGLQVISMAAAETNRGGILSALYLLSYLSMGALALVLGAIATTRGLSLAVDLGAATIILMNVATLVLATTTPATVSPSTVPPSCTWSIECWQEESDEVLTSKLRELVESKNRRRWCQPGQFLRSR